MNVSLTPKLEEFVRRKVASGLYNNASEVVREALRLFVERDAAATKVMSADPPTKEQIRAKLVALKQPLRDRGLTSLSLFGSILRGEARPDSDIDVLVDIDPGSRFSLIDLVSVKHFLQQELDHDVDVVTRDGIEPAIRDKVLRDAENVF